MAEPSKEAQAEAAILAGEYGLEGFERPLALRLDTYAAARVAEARAQERERCLAAASVALRNWAIDRGFIDTGDPGDWDRVLKRALETP